MVFDTQFQRDYEKKKKKKNKKKKRKRRKKSNSRLATLISNKFYELLVSWSIGFYSNHVSFRKNKR